MAWNFAAAQHAEVQGQALKEGSAELLVNAAKATITHTQNMVAGSHSRQHLGYDGIYLIGYMGTVAHRGQGLRGIPVQTAGVAIGQVSFLQAPG